MNKIPPHNAEAEKAVLAAGLLNRESLYTLIYHLTEDDFYLSENRILFQVIVDLDSAEKPVDLVMLKTELSNRGKLDTIGGVAALAQLYKSSAVSNNISAYVKELKELSRRRALIISSKESLDTAYDMQIAVNEIVNNLSMSIDSVSERKDSSCHIADLMDLEKLRAPESYIKTGFDTLDKYLYGLFKGEQIIIAGRPSQGKTALALAIAKHVAKDYSVLFNSIEMPREQLAIRLLSNDTELPFMKIKVGNLHIDELTNLQKAAQEMTNLNLIIQDQLFDIDEIVQNAKYVHRRKPLGLIVTDYLQLARTTQGGNTNEKVSYISSIGKQMAKQLQVPHIFLCQLNRAIETENRLPRLSDLRDSGSIEQDADVVIFISNPLEQENDPAREVDEKRIIIAKGRNIRLGDFPMLFYKKFTLFKD